MGPCPVVREGDAQAPPELAGQIALSIVCRTELGFATEPMYNRRSVTFGCRDGETRWVDCRHDEEDELALHRRVA